MRSGCPPVAVRGDILVIEGQVRPSLLCVAGSSICALPLEHVIEAARPMPIEPLAGAPSFIAGFSIIRGTPIPVVSVDLLLGGSKGGYERLVVVRAGKRRAGLLFQGVIGTRSLSGNVFAGLPPLLSTGSRAVAEMGALDGELVTLLDATKIVPDDVFAMLEALELVP